MISLWHDCRGILGHSSLLQFNGVCRHSCRHSSLKGPPPHFRQVDFDHYNTFFSFPAVLFVLVLEIFVLLHDPVLGFSCLTDDPPFAPEYFKYGGVCGQRNNSKVSSSCSKPRRSPLHHHARQLVWGVCVNVQYLFFTKYGAVLCGQTHQL